ncbi:MAG: hypothetical protein DRI97_03880 [Bacteroidetes bacterium]|nr:MAG: hypothetical protein DRI97_03880 [Bacteroidota bacterium]
MKPKVMYEEGGPTGNSFYLLGAAKKALQKQGIDEDKITDILKEAAAGDRQHLIDTLERYVEFELYYT